MSQVTWADYVCRNLDEISANRSQEFTWKSIHLPQEHKTKGINLTQLKNIDLASTCIVSKQDSMSESELSTFLLQINVKKGCKNVICTKMLSTCSST